MSAPAGKDRAFTVTCKLCRALILTDAQLDAAALKRLRRHLDEAHTGVLRVGFYAPDLGTILKEFDVLSE